MISEVVDWFVLGSLGRVGGVLSYCLTGFLFCAAILVFFFFRFYDSLFSLPLRLLYPFSSSWDDGPVLVECLESRYADGFAGYLYASLIFRARAPELIEGTQRLYQCYWLIFFLLHFFLLLFLAHRIFIHLIALQSEQKYRYSTTKFAFFFFFTRKRKYHNILWIPPTNERTKNTKKKLSDRQSSPPNAFPPTNHYYRLSFFLSFFFSLSL